MADVDGEGDGVGAIEDEVDGNVTVAAGGRDVVDTPTVMVDVDDGTDDVRVRLAGIEMEEVAEGRGESNEPNMSVRLSSTLSKYVLNVCR